MYRAWLRQAGALPWPKHPDLSGNVRRLELQTLRTSHEYESAIEELRSLGLHTHFNPPKNWDALRALKRILSTTGPQARILDAGGEDYSPLVEWLYLYGYDDLYVQNIDFDRDFRRGPIRYQKADFTDQHFQPNSFDVIACLSVIEHGLDVDTVLKEFYRTLRPDGSLVISTDFWPDKITTSGRATSYGESEQGWEIFSERQIKEMLRTAVDIGFTTPERRDFSVDQRVFDWNGEEYTAVYFELKK